MSEPHSSIDRPEPGEPRWPDTTILELSANERHSPIWKNAQRYYDSGVSRTAVRTLEALLAAIPVDQYPAADRRIVEDILYAARSINSYIEQPDRWQRHKALVQTAQDIPLVEPGRGADWKNIDRITKWLAAQEQSRILMTSSTHTATPHLLAAATREFQKGLRKTGVLSFDHHSDIQDYGPNDAVYKSNAMTGVLDRSGVSALAVVGVENTDSEFIFTPKWNSGTMIHGRSFYDQAMQPQRDMFLQRLRKLFASWKRDGVMYIYPTVDLDGLDLHSNQYTGVDYNDLHYMMELLNLYYPRIANIQPRDFNQLVATAKDNHVHPHYGIPDDWIPDALQLAKAEFGLEIGIPHDTKDQRLVGDVVEYDGPDYNGNTRRAGQQLLKGILEASQ